MAMTPIVDQRYGRCHSRQHFYCMRGSQTGETLFAAAVFVYGIFFVSTQWMKTNDGKSNICLRNWWTRRCVVELQIGHQRNVKSHFISQNHVRRIYFYRLDFHVTTTKRKEKKNFHAIETVDWIWWTAVYFRLFFVIFSHVFLFARFNFILNAESQQFVHSLTEMQSWAIRHAVNRASRLSTMKQITTFDRSTVPPFDRCTSNELRLTNERLL